MCSHAVEDCIDKNVPAICVISAGFSECDAEGRAREAALLTRIRQAGCRLVGPNCMGLLNTDPAVRLNATFSPVYPPVGNVAMSTQSGALGLAILDYARRLDIGISSFVSVGNKADVSGNDLIQYWADDPRTSVILLYLESFGNPRKFSEIARRVARSKPIVAVKAGRSTAGSRAAASHTGALASSDTVVDALFRQAGVIRTERLEELFDVAALLSQQPVPRGRRVAILTNAGGPGILAADACEAQRAGAAAAERGHTRGAALVSAGGGERRQSGRHAGVRARRSLPPRPGDDSARRRRRQRHHDLHPSPGDRARRCCQRHRGGRARHSGKPVLGVFMRAEGAPAALAPIPVATRSRSPPLWRSRGSPLRRSGSQSRWTRRPWWTESIATRYARSSNQVLARGGGWSTSEEATALLAAAGIESAAARTVTGVDAAVQAAAAIGYPVALKALGPTLLHKTERRAVCLNLGDAAGVADRLCGFFERLGSDMIAVLVQRMVPRGVEMIVGALQNPLFGPLVACGTGGVLVDVLADTAFRLHPLSAADARDMIGRAAWGEAASRVSRRAACR